MEIDLVLDMLSADRETATQKYKEFMAQEEVVDFEKVRTIGEAVEDREIRTSNNNKVRKSLDEILLSTGADESLLELIKSGSRQRNLTEYKLAYAKEALGANYTLKEIGRNIKISDAAIVEEEFVNGTITGRPYSGASERFIADKLQKDPGRVNKATNYLCCLGIISKTSELSSAITRQPDRFVINYGLSIGEIKEIVLKLGVHGLFSFNKELVTRTLGAETANRIFRRISDKQEIEARLPEPPDPDEYPPEDFPTAPPKENWELYYGFYQ